MSSDAALLDRRQQVLGRHSPLLYDRPLHLVRGDGVWVEDVDGCRYLDAYNNVPHVGHCHPHVVDAICRQSALLNTHTRYLHEKIVEYAERLTATFDPSLSVAMLTCTGTEANELALRIARFASGGTGIIVSDFSYHGNSAALASVTTGLPAPEALAPYARAVPIPDIEKHGGNSPENLAEEYANRVRDAVESLRAAGIKTAAILFDTLFSTEGLPRVPKGFLEKAVGYVRAAGGLYIADEVQAGLGRTGDHMWGHQAYDVVPDIVTLGKPMGNGHPLAGLVTRPELLDAFGSSALYFNTFAGNPVSAAAGLAVLDVMETENLIANAKSVGAHVQESLHKLNAKHEVIGKVRGAGLFFGLELTRGSEPAAADARRVVNGMRESGVLISKVGQHDNVLKMRPPMPFSKTNADLLISKLDHVLASL